MANSNKPNEQRAAELENQLFSEGIKNRRAVVADEFASPRPGQRLRRIRLGWHADGPEPAQRAGRAYPGRRNNGLTEQESREAIVHATIYCGVPSGMDAMKIA